MEKSKYTGINILLDVEQFAEELDRWSELKQKELALAKEVNELHRKRKRKSHVEGQLKAVQQKMMDIAWKHFEGFAQAVDDEMVLKPEPAYGGGEARDLGQVGGISDAGGGY